MTSTQTTDLVINSLSTYGVAILAILGSVVTVGVAYLIFQFGWRKVQSSTGFDPIENARRNKRYATQIRNSEILDAGDKVQTSTRW